MHDGNRGKPAVNLVQHYVDWWRCGVAPKGSISWVRVAGAFSAGFLTSVLLDFTPLDRRHHFVWFLAFVTVFALLFPLLSLLLTCVDDWRRSRKG